MKFGPETLGLLVRPRILISANILVLNSAEPSTFFKLKPSDNNTYAQSEKLFGKSIVDLFSEISLGNTSLDTQKAYLGKVVAYEIKVGSVTMIVDDTNINQALIKVRNRYGIRTNLKILSVGIQFFRGFVRSQYGQIQPLDPWLVKTQDGFETIWFYKPWDLVPITEIIKYESTQKGDLVLFHKTHGLVVKKKPLNKPSFYLTSSWSCYSITLLNHMGDGLIRFLPDRKFTVRTREEQDEFNTSQVGL